MGIDLAQNATRAIDGTILTWDFYGGEHGRMERLTNIPGHPVDVNMDQVAFIECPQGVTELHFINDAAGPKGTVILNVRESLDDIHMKKPLRS